MFPSDFISDNNVDTKDALRDVIEDLAVVEDQVDDVMDLKKRDRRCGEISGQ